MHRALKACFLIAAAMLVLAAAANAVNPPTMRLDYYHTGNATQEMFSFDRVVYEPLPWPGDMSKTIDDTSLGNYFFEVRDQALRVLEEARQAKHIGKRLEADVDIAASGEELELLQRHAAGLKEILNVSHVTVRQSTIGAALEVSAQPAAGSKCARCWNFMLETADYDIWHDVCGRCRSALKEMGIAPPKPEVAK